MPRRATGQQDNGDNGQDLFHCQVYLEPAPAGERPL
jgi:hypothetical protein